ncbi:COX6A, subunit VIa of cytochrome c oxidase [Sparassis latifolia]|uniref:Cytochrome c oxidase subunit 6A, mitochondrial n=1 Tax=Sparassis crispa TaxID=139825 RepID=A0A401G6P9_9APHY|nr:Cytochrome c oxidase subunit 6A, mitochondrial [Sparassis crispa]GBE77827.1 Cytochrome c oxidase subunit 6A, mitochondrial [Sparassis crispa]
MSSIIARRALLRAVPRTRSFASATADVVKSDYMEKQAALYAHAAETANLWRRISFFVCAPAIFVCSIWVYKLESEHHEHEAHLMAENDGHLPDPPAYEYLNRRAAGSFPWGPNSLFFNPKTNKDMSKVDQ